MSKYLFALIPCTILSACSNTPSYEDGLGRGYACGYAYGQMDTARFYGAELNDLPQTCAKEEKAGETAGFSRTTMNELRSGRRSNP